MPTFEKTTRMAVPAEELAAWHHRPGAFERLNPPWKPARILEPVGQMVPGATGAVSIQLGPFRKRWGIRIAEVGPLHFVDEMTEGPLAFWRHEHRFQEVSATECDLIDRIEYRLPGGALGQALAGASSRRDLAGLFAYRHRLTKEDLERHAKIRPHLPSPVLVTGATGLLGQALVPFLQTQGVEVWRLTRNPQGERDLGWDLKTGEIDLASGPAFAGVVHLAGANIAGGRWTPERKRAILESRQRGTDILCRALVKQNPLPEVLVSASGVSCYATGPTPRAEDGEWGTGFLAEVCRVWEEATKPAAEAGVRVVPLRTAAVLDPRGGALGKLLPIFRLGLGGPVGSGRQHFPWIALDDHLDVILRGLAEKSWEGPVNSSAPTLTTNGEFTKALGRVLRRPTLLPVPTLAVKAAFGQMGEEVLLADQPVVPARLQKAGLAFRFPEIAGALAHMLGKV